MNHGSNERSMQLFNYLETLEIFSTNLESFYASKLNKKSDSTTTHNHATYFTCSFSLCFETFFNFLENTMQTSRNIYRQPRNHKWQKDQQITTAPIAETRMNVMGQACLVFGWLMWNDEIWNLLVKMYLCSSEELEIFMECWNKFTFKDFIIHAVSSV